MEILKQPWHWSVVGILIGLTVPLLLLLGSKRFGISSSLKHICAMCVPANIPFFKYDWKKELWSIFFVAGIVLGGILASWLLKNPEPMEVAEATKTKLAVYGISNYNELLPTEIFSWENLLNLKGLVFFVFGGFCVGFGTRYANGCTSGHSISGLANFELSSLIATIFFMVGGFVSSNFIIPAFFKLF